MGRHRFAEADTELVEYFTAALGLGAQRYEPTGSHAFNSHDLHEAMMRSAFQGRFMSKTERGPFTRFDAFAKTLARVEHAQREILCIVYSETDTLIDGGEDVALDVGRLSLALRPKYGHGSFVRLAVRQERVLRAFERHREGHATVFDFLEAQADRGEDAKSWFQTVKQDCEAVRTPALAAYEAARLERVEAKGEARRQHNASLDAELGRSPRRRRAPRPELQEVCDFVAAHMPIAS